jgi:hypothetical protein
MNGNHGSTPSGLQINFQELDELACPECGFRHFAATQKIKYIPAILSPNGQAGTAQLTVGVTCISCGYFISAKDLLSGTANYVSMSDPVVEDAKVISPEDKKNEG